MPSRAHAKFYPGCSLRDDPFFQVVGQHPELGAGVLFWLHDEFAANYNAGLVNAGGGKARVEHYVSASRVREAVALLEEGHGSDYFVSVTAALRAMERASLSGGTPPPPDRVAEMVDGVDSYLRSGYADGPGLTALMEGPNGYNPNWVNGRGQTAALVAVERAIQDPAAAEVSAIAVARMMDASLDLFQPVPGEPNRTVFAALASPEGGEVRAALGRHSEEFPHLYQMRVGLYCELRSPALPREEFAAHVPGPEDAALWQSVFARGEPETAVRNPRGRVALEQVRHREEEAAEALEALPRDRNVSVASQQVRPDGQENTQPTLS